VHLKVEGRHRWGNASRTIHDTARLGLIAHGGPRLVTCHGWGAEATVAYKLVSHHYSKRPSVGIDSRLRAPDPISTKTAHSDRRLERPIICPLGLKQNRGQRLLLQCRVVPTTWARNAAVRSKKLHPVFMYQSSSGLFLGHAPWFVLHS